MDAVIEKLKSRIAELESEIEFLKHNPNYDTLTRQGLELEHRRLGKGERFVVVIDLDYLHKINEQYGSQEPVNELIRRAFSFRDDDLLLKGNYASGDEVAFVVKSDPQGFMGRLQVSLAEQGLSATMAYTRIINDDLWGACDRAIKRVYKLKALRGVESR